MESLIIEATKSSPLIDFKADTGILRIEGESYPENAAKFYKPVLNWVKRFLLEGKPDVVAEILVRYMNTSSSKCMMTFLEMLDESRDDNIISVNWRYEKGNDTAREWGMEFCEDLSLPFRLVEE
jgi:hypothetical protein